ncbi:restriction endonuclease [Salmonella enterica]|uniref:antirestriction Ral family protein n=1 Tax=Salmonella enterica TaxID=28901 RepID=UPI0010129155|nr:antirestriction Ral family protein [Salmonella enterica]RXO38215.1 restriction endonuclease [Salmonella enterica]
MNTTIDTNQWCGQFDRCKGCKLDAECMVKPEEMALVIEDGKYVDRWAIRTTAMISRELEKQKKQQAAN